ncbi:hypothetical protein [Nocardioides sp. Leaf285]|uniref:hypothetical protein n=1 Tax=Nocardioides sp. Leaf285 TaxID=1736322 RepID=UPI0007030A01|nr:hypothetical protein [Nocardioides sp. Leaf285]KQP62995.1 hypothetical protein ASF47_18460 [Nocardioides sp. Leaf285]
MPIIPAAVASMNDPRGDTIEQHLGHRHTLSPAPRRRADGAIEQVARCYCGYVALRAADR